MPGAALITGGTGTIGLAIAESLADAGHHILVNCPPQDAARSEQLVAERKRAGMSIELSIFDVTDHQASKTALTALDARQPISVLINNAGITRDARLVKLEPADWDAVLSTNLDGVYHVTRQLIEPMVARGFGRIINISSVNGVRGQFGQTNYSAAKAGMLGFNAALAREVARHGITVNAVSPGYVVSPMTDAIPAAVRDKVIEEIPLGRFAEASEIARYVAFLAHADSSYITGTNLSINGGYHIG